MAAIQINMAANSKGCGAQTLQNVQKTAAKHMSGMAAKKLRIIQAAGTSDQSAAVAAQRVEETLQEWQLSKLWLRIRKAADLKRCRKMFKKSLQDTCPEWLQKSCVLLKGCAWFINLQIQAAGTSDQSAATVAAQRVEETLQEWQLFK